MTEIDLQDDIDISMRVLRAPHSPSPLDFDLTPVLCRISTSLPTVVSIVFCYCCVLFRNNCPVLLWLLLLSKGRSCPAGLGLFLAVSRFCQMTPLTPPPVASWGSASRQSARLWRSDQKRSVRHYYSVARGPRCWRSSRY